MSFSFKSAGHAVATFLKAAVKDAPKVLAVAEADLTKVGATKAEVETGTAAILGATDPALATTAVGVEDASYAVLGEVVALLQAGGAAAAAKLVDAGLDKNVVSTAQAVAAGTSQIGTLISAATKK